MVEKETLLDKTKVKYATRLEEGSSFAPTTPLPPETCPRSTGYLIPPEGFALNKQRKFTGLTKSNESTWPLDLPSDKKAARRLTRKLLQQKWEEQRDWTGTLVQCLWLFDNSTSSFIFFQNDSKSEIADSPLRTSCNWARSGCDGGII